MGKKKTNLSVKDTKRSMTNNCGVYYADFNNASNKKTYTIVAMNNDRTRNKTWLFDDCGVSFCERRFQGIETIYKSELKYCNGVVSYDIETEMYKAKMCSDMPKSTWSFIEKGGNAPSKEKVFADFENNVKSISENIPEANDVLESLIKRGFVATNDFEEVSNPNFSMSCKSNFNMKKEGINESYYNNGQIKIRFTCKNGKIEGLYEEWYKNGQLRVRCNYKDGKFDGLYEDWYNNGKLRCSKNYKDGGIDGLYEEWHDNGKSRFQYIYKDGKFVREATKEDLKKYSFSMETNSLTYYF